jgi:phytoene desaturase
LDVHADIDAMADEVALVCGSAAADGYRRYVEFVSRMYRYEMRDFIDRNIDSPLGLLTPSLARIVAAGGFRRLAPKVRSYLPDPRLQRVFSFQSMYAGLAPQEALALYAVIAYMDSVAGVYFPRGGMHAVPVALASAAAKHGVVFHYGVTVSSVEVVGSRAVAVVTSDGARVPCDALVLNPDHAASMRLLGRSPRRLTYSPSCFVMHVGSRATYSRTAHHTIHFGRAWEQVFREVIHEGRLMSDPSFLVTNPSASDPSLAPEGRQSYYLLFPTPNLSAPIDWALEGPRYRDSVVSTLEARGYVGFGDAIDVESVTTPADWGAQGLELGTPFAAAHTFRQTGPFRPRNHWGENVAFAGSGTVPGVGVPMVLISGRLAAERLIGPTR